VQNLVDLIRMSSFIGELRHPRHGAGCLKIIAPIIDQASPELVRIGASWQLNQYAYLCLPQTGIVWALYLVRITSAAFSAIR
jgi:hypothetical protein